jgi:U3 small nucleolar RNA-associated protein 5
VFDIPRKRLVRTLIASSGVKSLSLFDGINDQGRLVTRQQLAAVTQTGLVEIFSRPFVDTSEADARASLKMKRKNMTRKANATIHIARADSVGSTLPIFDASFQGPDMVFAWTEGGVNLSFEKMRWMDEDSRELALLGSEEIIASKKVTAFNSETRNGVKDPAKTRVDESHTVVVNGGAEEDAEDAPSELSAHEEGHEDGEHEESASESDEESYREEEVEVDNTANSELMANGVDASISDNLDVDMTEAEPAPAPDHGNDDDQEEGAEPSFGDLVGAKSTEPISIVEALPSAEAGALVATVTRKDLAIPSGISLSTVLTQALRTNDNNLLESCFHNTDTEIIRSTIQRIDSSLAGTLIQKLAERLSSRPGRYGHLLVWVQWICVAHGGALGGRPEILNKIKTLYKVLNQRSKALDSLLLLKGKLDMLDAQLGLRKQLLAERGAPRDPDEGHVIYIEGEEKDDTSDEDEAMGGAPTSASPSKRKPQKTLQELVPEGDGSSDDDEDMPLTNGIIAESDASDYDSDEEAPVSQQEGGLVDDEAEESDEDSHPSDREEAESEDEVNSEDEDDSEMDDFIDDGPVEEVDSASEISIDQTPEKPPPKKNRRK